MNYFETLNKLGLKPNEIKVYVTLLEHAPASIRQIAGVTGINRGSVYEAIKCLSKTGLVSFNIKGKRRHYFAEGPEKINDIVRDKKLELFSVESKVKDLIPELNSLISNAPDHAPIVRFYEDDEGVATILRDVLAVCDKLSSKEYCVYSSRPNRHYIYRRFPNFTKQRIEKNIFVKVIAVGEGGEKVELAERKWLPEPGHYHQSSYTIIYGSKVASIGVSSNEVPYGVVVEDPNATSMSKLLFEHLWVKLD